MLCGMYRYAKSEMLSNTHTHTHTHTQTKYRNPRCACAPRVNNSAGAISSRVKIENTNKIEFINCTWIGNSATIGAAMHLRPAAESSLFDGRAPTPLLHDCSFIDNQVVLSAEFLLNTKYNATKHVLETGTLHIESIEVEFKGYVLISGSAGSGIVATSAQINVLENTTVHFVNNRATKGGAMALLGFSILELYSDSHVIYI